MLLGDQCALDPVHMWHVGPPTTANLLLKFFLRDWKGKAPGQWPIALLISFMQWGSWWNEPIKEQVGSSWRFEFSDVNGASYSAKLTWLPPPLPLPDVLTSWVAGGGEAARIYCLLIPLVTMPGGVGLLCASALKVYFKFSVRSLLHHRGQNLLGTGTSCQSVFCLPTAGTLRPMPPIVLNYRHSNYGTSLWRHKSLHWVGFP